MNFVRTQGFRKLSSDRQTDTQTDTTEIIIKAVKIIAVTILTQCHKIAAQCRLKNSFNLIVKISSSLSTKIFDCGIYSN